MTQTESDTAGDASSPPLLTLHWDGDRPPEPPSWCVRNLFPSGSVNLIAGESRAGKSFLGIHLGVCVAQGKPFFGFATEKGGVLYAAAEGAFTIPQRLRAAKLGMPSTTLPFTHIKEVPDLTQDEGLNLFIASGRKANELMLGNHNVPLSLVIIDTLIAAFPIKSWNDAADTSKVINVLARISRELGVTVVGIHHHGKDTARGAVGSFTLTAGPDIMLSVFREADRNEKVTSRHITIAKSRLVEEGWTCHFELEGVQTDLQDGEPVYSAFVKPLLETAGFGKVSSKQTKPTAPKQGPDAFAIAFEDALRSKGTDHPNPDGSGIVRAVPVAAVKDIFLTIYKPKTGSSNPADAARGAFNRAFKIAGGPIKQGTWGGQDWLYSKADASG
jgi:hypothetical protein